MPEYRCKGKNCNFATDDIGEFIRHVIREEAHPPKPKVRHKSAGDYVACPECYPRLEKELLKRGWTKPEEKKKETEQKGLLG